MSATSRIEPLLVVGWLLLAYCGYHVELQPAAGAGRVKMVMTTTFVIRRFGMLFLILLVIIMRLFDHTTFQNGHGRQFCNDIFVFGCFPLAAGKMFR
jgi:hypothetical protein